MRKTVEPPPVSRCDRCGGQLTLKRTDAAHATLGLISNIYVCANCGQERSFVSRPETSGSRLQYELRPGRL